jgi:hypothetical protein
MVLGLLVATALMPSRSGLAYEGPWCAIVNQGSEVVEELCSMPSFEMCRIEARRWGPTAFCRQNPRFPGYWAPPDESPRHRAKRHYHR